MDKIKRYTYKKLLKLISNKFTQKYAGKFIRYKEAFEKGEDIIFREAPHMIVVSSAINAPCANVDPIIALSYIELYANSLGLGTCWCGFAQACFKILPRLSNIVKIPDGYKPVYVMLLGTPSVKYHRTIVPDEVPIAIIDDTDIVEMSIGEKIKRLFLNFIR
jgi:nitroreductase